MFARSSADAQVYDPLASVSLVEQMRNAMAEAKLPRKVPLVGHLPIVRQFQVLGILLVTFLGVAAFVAGVVAYAQGAVPAAETLPLAGVALILAAALSRRYGIALPGNGFSSYVVGVMLYAVLDPRVRYA